MTRERERMTTTTGANRARAFQPGMRDSLGTSRRTPSWDLRTERRLDDGETLARGLAWFSIGLGLAELTAGRWIADALGMRSSAPLIRLYGLREIGQGIGILRSRHPRNWIFARIAGDALDLATLAPGLSPRNRRRRRARSAALAVAGAAALDVICAYQLTEQRRHPIREAAPKSGSGGRAEAAR